MNENEMEIPMLEEGTTWWQAFFYSARAVTSNSRGSFSASRIFSINPTPSPGYALLTPLGLSIVRSGSRIFRFLTSFPVIMSDYGNDDVEET